MRSFLLKFEVEPGVLRDLHAYGGLVLMAVGAGMLWPPAGLIVFGLGIAGLGIFAGRLP